ncbi:hypothetical protein HCG51_08045 [Tolypothrix sp. PCC 7910]|uniref:hypothetical protein n=1 Tax=Tolypothrix sp. PCC 7910 TaxID=2099387 RepID=UPI0014279739|nr:hypothetical protein [Tolypothrix sp. PCC 7910]QIR36706.1 hypothetical protein HCG51_08045 [Tolypothrix sp. PCC 7910]
MDFNQHIELDSSKVFLDIEKIFQNNLKLSLLGNVQSLYQAELKARAFAIVGQILREAPDLSPTHKEITAIFNELFTDLVISIYLAGCSLDKPAQSLLRRVLELGIAVVYLWDSPHQFWGWKCHDKDLNFNEMIECLDSESYKLFVLSENTNFLANSLFNITETRKIYRKLSNIIHGKISTFETLVPERFSYNKSDWEEHLNLVLQVENILIELFKNRFNNLSLELEKKLPAISRLL